MQEVDGHYPQDTGIISAKIVFPQKISTPDFRDSKIPPGQFVLGSRCTGSTPESPEYYEVWLLNNETA